MSGAPSSRALDGQSLSAQRRDEILGVSEPKLVGRHITEAPDRHAQTPLKAAAGLGRAIRIPRSDEMAMQPLGRHYLERARGDASRRLARGFGVRLPLAAIHLLHQEATFGIGAIVVPAVPCAPQMDVVGLPW